MQYTDPRVEEEFVVYFFTDRSSTVQYGVMVIVSGTLNLILYLTTVYPAQILYLVFCLVSLLLPVVLVVLLVRLNSGTQELLAKTWAQESEAAELLLFRRDKVVYQRSLWHETIAIGLMVVLASFGCGAVWLRVECAGLSLGSDDYKSCQHTLTAEANCLTAIVLIGARFVRYKRACVIGSCFTVAAFLTYYFTNDRVWEHTASLSILVVALLVGALLNGRQDEGLARQRFEANVERRVATLQSAELKKRTKETLAAQVPPGAGMAAALSDKDGIWCATSTMAVCSVSVFGFNEWMTQAAPNDAVSLLLKVFGATEDALVGSGTTAARYHALGDAYDVALALSGTQEERGEQLRRLVQFAVLASVTATSSLNSDADERFMGIPRDRQPQVRTVLHAGTGCSVTLWASKNVVLGGPVAAAVSALRDTVAPPVSEHNTATLYSSSWYEVSARHLLPIPLFPKRAGGDPLSVILVSEECAAMFFALHSMTAAAAAAVGPTSSLRRVSTHLDGEGGAEEESNLVLSGRATAASATTEDSCDLNPSSMGFSSPNPLAGPSPLMKDFTSGNRFPHLEYVALCVVVPVCLDHPIAPKVPHSSFHDSSSVTCIDHSATLLHSLRSCSAARGNSSNSSGSGTSNNNNIVTSNGGHETSAAADIRIVSPTRQRDEHRRTQEEENVSISSATMEMGPEWCWFGHAFVDSEVERGYIAWAREPFDLPRVHGMCACMLLCSVVLLALLVLYVDKFTFHVYSAPPYAIATVLVSVGLTVLIVVRGDQSPKWLVMLLYFLFNGFSTVVFALAPEGTAIGNAPFAIIVLYMTVRTARPTWYTPIVFNVPGMVYCVILLVLTIVEPRGTLFHVWLARTYYSNGLVQAYRIGSAMDRAARDEYVMYLRGQQLQRELERDLMLFERVLQDITPKGIAQLLVVHSRRVQVDPAASRRRLASRLDMTRQSMNVAAGWPSLLDNAIAQMTARHVEDHLRIPTIGPHSLFMALLSIRHFVVVPLSREVVAASVEAQLQSPRILAAAHATVAALLAETFPELQLVKASIDTIVVATEMNTEDPRRLLEFVCLVHNEMSRFDGLDHRAVVSRGCVTGCVLGSHSVSFEYYGDAMSVGLQLLKEVP